MARNVAFLWYSPYLVRMKSSVDSDLLWSNNQMQNIKAQILTCIVYTIALSEDFVSFFSQFSLFFHFLIIYWQQKASFHLKGYSIFNGYKVLILLYLFAVLVCCWCCFWRTVTTIFLFYFFFPFLFFLSLFLLQFFSYLYLLISVQNGEFSTLESWETMKQCETTNKMIKPEFKASGQLLSFFNGFFKAAWSKHGHVIILCAMKYSELTLNYTHIFRSQTKYDVSKHKELITIR